MRPNRYAQHTHLRRDALKEEWDLLDLRPQQCKARASFSIDLASSIPFDVVLSLFVGGGVGPGGGVGAGGRTRHRHT